MSATHAAVPTPTRRYPPVTELAAASLALLLAGGVDLAAHLPHRPALALPAALVAAGAAVGAADGVLLARHRSFPWPLFARVLRWSLLAYAVIAGMIEYVFVLDGTRGATLAVLTAALVVFALDVPLVLAFTVARYTGGTPAPAVPLAPPAAAPPSRAAPAATTTGAPGTD